MEEVRRGKIELEFEENKQTEIVPSVGISINICYIMRHGKNAY